MNCLRILKWLIWKVGLCIFYDFCRVLQALKINNKTPQMNSLFDKWFIRHIQLVKCHWEFHISVQASDITVKWKMSCKMRQRHISFVMFVHLQKLFLWKWNRVWHSFNKKEQNIISILCHYLFDEYMLRSTHINNCLKKKP